MMNVMHLKLFSIYNSKYGNVGIELQSCYIRYQVIVICLVIVF